MLKHSLFSNPLVAVFLIGTLAACVAPSPTPPAVIPSVTQPVTPTSIPPSSTPLPFNPTSAPPTSTPLPDTATPQPETTTPQLLTPTLAPLPPEPQEVNFQAYSGPVLHGTYYPAAVNPAPVVVLMHWVRGDQKDWTEIAYWLQNRGLGGKSLNPKKYPWLDSSWFPKMPEGRSYAVFTFTYRRCEGGCGEFLQLELLRDAQAAMLKAQTLPGVDPRRMIAVGASIGADSAASSCLYINGKFPNSCQGALVLSPGNYLSLPFISAVVYLQSEKPPKPLWCLYSRDDEDSAKTCKPIPKPGYRAVEYPGVKHGMELITPGKSPDPLQLLLDFLDLTLEKK